MRGGASRRLRAGLTVREPTGSHRPAGSGCCANNSRVLDHVVDNSRVHHNVVDNSRVHHNVVYNSRVLDNNRTLDNTAPNGVSG